jgi:hypothetical protein
VHVAEGEGDDGAIEDYIKKHVPLPINSCDDTVATIVAGFIARRLEKTGRLTWTNCSSSKSGSMILCSTGSQTKPNIIIMINNYYYYYYYYYYYDYYYDYYYNINNNKYVLQKLAYCLEN